MPDPWDPFPFPPMGDENPYDTYSAVGLVISEWESIEFNLARLFSVFMGDGPSGEAIRGYGKGNIFRERRANLEHTAEKYFIVRCDQGLEGEFNRLCTIASGFADRRNEVAHGIVMEVGAVQFFTQRLLLAMPGRKQHLVVPPYHSIRKHDFVGMPSFAYNAEQLKTLARRLIAFGGEIVAYRERL